MLEKLDLSLKVSKDEYKYRKMEMEARLGELQRNIKELGIPVIIVFEGWGASGKGTLINKLILPLDPRGFSVYTTNKLNEEELLRPFLWRYWIRTPARGRIAIFDKSWYRKVLVERVDAGIEGKRLDNYFNDIRTFEKQLAQDGCVIIKFYLHISKREQSERFKKLEKSSSTAWRVTPEDWKHNEEYEKYLPVIDDMIRETDKSYAPWVVVEAEDRRFAELKIINSLIDILGRTIDKRDVEKSAELNNGLMNITIREINIAKNNDPREMNSTMTISKAEYKKKLKEYQDEIRVLEHEIYRNRLPVVIVYEGWDAAGKGGNIKRMTENMDPRGYEVIPVGAPNEVEKSHHYLWRFWKEMPKAGHIAIFDRSWYGRVLVERVEGFCTAEAWKRAYDEINEMEKQLSNFGVVINKFWLQIDRDEQLRRFIERQEDPLKQWKITAEDWRNREKWGLYEDAVSDMLGKTNTAYAPWTIIESNDKHYSRIRALETVIGNLRRELKR